MAEIVQDEEDQQSQEIDKSKECGTDQESKEREEREANLALSLAIIREDAEGRDETPVPMSKRPRDEEQSEAYVDDMSHKGPLKEAGEKLPADNNLQTSFDADLQSNPTPLTSHKKQCCGPPNPPLNEPAVDPPQRNLTEAPSSYSNSTTAPLDHYIRLVCKSQSLPSLSEPYFSSSNKSPVLRRDRKNKIIVYRGSFNPPHLGHLELAYYTFLRSSSTMIAILLLPISDLLYAKDGARVNGKDFATTKAQGISLLQDDLLQRWSWFYEGKKCHKFSEYRAALIDMASRDGFRLNFTYLNGSDHYSKAVKKGTLTYLSHETEDMIISDITCPSSLFIGPDSSPAQLPGCGPWRLAYTPVSDSGDFTCRCRKFCAECHTSRRIREYCGGHTALEGEPHALSRQEKILYEILVRCHDGGGEKWVCNRDRGGVVTFFGSETAYRREDSEREEISSSIIRKILGKGGSKAEMIEKLEKVMLNPELLLQYLEPDN
ncbi:hypothetical protein BKA58DRAFT_452946 [Alternaria rosae]|uniref:uncharacterized protein n=1 Tax=Alternaria rosae TaxID=1187941 RepID=UPI001E8D658E|nr:uncharacterized protein BKA58DRAFT_452946 [Alternaria rosae]KAH6878757.1 hypothetical protein BKA58DRAFT_452946 [Alternaria rosae]